jgi:hypothetical protein
MTLGRTEIAPVKVSAGIEQVDVNTSKLSLRFLLKVKWSDPLVIPEQHPSGPAPRLTARGRLLAVCTVVKLLIILKAETSFRQTFVYLLF